MPLHDHFMAIMKWNVITFTIMEWSFDRMSGVVSLYPIYSVPKIRGMNYFDCYFTVLFGRAHFMWLLGQIFVVMKWNLMEFTTPSWIFDRIIGITSSHQFFFSVCKVWEMFVFRLLLIFLFIHSHFVSFPDQITTIIK